MINPPPNQQKWDSNNDGLPDAAWKAFFTDVYTGISVTQTSGTTLNRPTKNLYAGRPYFDTTLNLPIWIDSSGSAWIKADGTPA